MSLPRTLVTGATGKTGSAVVRPLAARGDPVRALARVDDARSDVLRRQGAEVVVADVFDPDPLLAAMHGIQRAYYVPPIHPHAILSAVACAFEGGVTDVVDALTGVPAEPFETTARRYAALPFARQTLLDRAKAFVDLNLTVLHPVYDLERRDRGWGFPTPPVPTHSMDDERWRRAHRLPMRTIGDVAAPPVTS